MNRLLKTALIMTALAAGSVNGQEKNPLLMKWDTPYQTPPFAEIKNEHYRPAVKQGMDEARKNIDAIINSKETMKITKLRPIVNILTKMTEMNQLQFSIKAAKRD